VNYETITVVTTVRVNIVTVEKQEVLRILSVCVSVASFIQHGKRMIHIFCHLWPVRFFHNFPYYFIHGTALGGKCVV